jgi:hypothetical protein
VSDGMGRGGERTIHWRFIFPWRCNSLQPSTLLNFQPQATRWAVMSWMWEGESESQGMRWTSAWGGVVAIVVVGAIDNMLDSK